MNRTKQQDTENTTTRIVIQGYPGAFHEIAARFYESETEVDIVPAFTFDELVETLEEKEQADIGLMAIENTLAGSLLHNYNLINTSNLTIRGEVFLRIKQNLMTLPGQQIEKLKEVHSHPIAIAQCRQFFRKYPHIRLIEMADTALSAKNIREQNLRDVGAIASTLAADMYDMEVIAHSIETNKKNYTRFLVLQHKDFAKQVKNANKVSLSFSISHEIGGLHKILELLAQHQVNLTKIQSVPIIGQPWEYRFFVDFVADESTNIQAAIGALALSTHQLNILGIYQKGEHYEY